jgi:hypothetical protein
VLADLAGQHDLVAVDDRLGVVPLQPAVGGLHDAAVGIGHVDLPGGRRRVLGGLLGGGQRGLGLLQGAVGAGREAAQLVAGGLGGLELGGPLGLLGLRAFQRHPVIDARAFQRGGRVVGLAAAQLAPAPGGLLGGLGGPPRGGDRRLLLGRDHRQRGLQPPPPPAGWVAADRRV